MGTISRRFSYWALALAAAWAVLACAPADNEGAASTEASAEAPPPPPPVETPDPRYTDEGDLIRPTDFHSSWVFVGSNTGLQYDPEAMRNTPRESARNSEVKDFHNIYMKPEDYEYYLTNKTFADRTVLIMDKYVAQKMEPQHIVVAGAFNGLPHGMEVAVKNRHRPDGSETDWAYYSFEVAEPGGEMPGFAKAHPNNECYDCHHEHGGFDNVWVQFYPVIRGVNPAAADKGAS